MGLLMSPASCPKFRELKNVLLMTCLIEIVQTVFDDEVVSGNDDERKFVYLSDAIPGRSALQIPKALQNGEAGH